MSVEHGFGLEDIPGLGPRRREALAEAGVQDLQGLLAMKTAELAAVRGIGLWQAQKIREYLRQRGIVLETEEDGEEAAVLLMAPEGADAAALTEAVSEAVIAMEVQASVEAQVEAQVEVLAEAVAEAWRREEEERVDALTREEAELLQKQATRNASPEPDPAVDDVRAAAAGAAPDTGPAGKGGAAAGAGSARKARAAGKAPAAEAEPWAPAEAPAGEAAPPWVEEIQERRQALPGLTLDLMEAIRQAAVSRQLTRQVTRLLVAASEFVSPAREPSDAARQEAAATLARAERALRRAVRDRAFSADDQKDLARRLRRWRKGLVRRLEQ